MSLRDLLVLYLVIGVACAIAVLTRAPGPRARVVASAVATVPLWPVWAPFALAGPSAVRAEARSAAGGRIDRALAEAVDTVAGTPMADVFSRAAAARIAEEVARVAARIDELGAIAARSGFDVTRSRERLAELEARGAPERVVATARVQHESLLRLDELRSADARALEELAELLEALRAQLLVARYSGESTEGVSAIVSEVWARLEGLGAAFDGARGDARPAAGGP